jgi:hypothetical protein
MKSNPKLHPAFAELHTDSDPTMVALEEQLTQWIGYLALDFPSEDVNQIMMQFWDLLNSDTVSVVLGPVRTPSTAFMKKGEDAVLLVIILPLDWLLLSKADPIMALGALIFCGSQAVDHYNDQLLQGMDSCLARGRAYEVEFLFNVKTIDATWEPNEYQAGIMMKYPLGIRTEGILSYVQKETPAVEPPVFMAIA